MTKIALFDAKPYDRASFDAANEGRYDFRYFEARLTAESVPLADGCAGVCAFVNDAVDAATVARLVARGVKVLALPGARWRTRSATAAPARSSRRSRRPAPAAATDAASRHELRHRLLRGGEGCELQ